jgi:HTH-type transcriptional regulator, transcriptional repressor of NAD biosynthesis genes
MNFTEEKRHYSVGFAFGKYCPLHKGHVSLIRYGMSICEKFYVIVCGSDKEPISTSTRAAWIREELSNDAAVHVVEYSYLECELPNTSESSRDVSQVWSAIFRGLLPAELGVIVTSEPYGEFVAQYMGIEHASYDQSRTNFPVSSTQVRADLLGSWDLLPAPVQRSYQRRIVLSGTESAGKSTLAAALVQHFNACRVSAEQTAVLVTEAARDIVGDSNSLDLGTLQVVATEHAGRVAAACALMPPRPLVVVDTDVYVTQSYAQAAFGETLVLSAEVELASAAHLRLYLAAEGVPFEQDGTRLRSEELRNQLDVSHRATLVKHGQHFVELRGAYEERFRRAVVLVGALFESVALP